SLCATHNPYSNAEIDSASRTSFRLPNHNTYINHKQNSSAIVSIEGLLGLVALVARYQVTADSGTQEGTVCQSEKSPPVQSANSRSIVAAVTSSESSTTDMAAGSTASWSDNTDRGGEP
ncbi:hypothetical protein, partial [Chroococcidiopsis sp [FACHB-1243]]|uniref:hypothetical protein n=1 Tax=Chroococcidiopsis sp. [FACHB-1243] TaxID=2692781 RepID=UPI001F54DD2F